MTTAPAISIPEVIAGKPLRGMTKRWRMKDSAADNAAADLVARVLAARGLSDPAKIKTFCEPKLSDLHDPGLLPGIDIAAERIIHALGRDEQIVIYGDYDVDGVAATAILYHTIKAIAPHCKLQTYVPHRLEEGYGLNCEALQQLRASGAQLVISVDCGVSAVKSAQTARDIGLDLIITDHHTPPIDRDSLPDAVAIVHPAIPGSAYPFAELCGAGVAFKLAWRLCTTWCNSQRVSETLQKTLLNMLPLAAMATIADVVPLVDENRIITHFGLRWIRQSPLIGLQALIEASSLGGEKIDAHKVGYVLGPRLNACGRMGHAAEAVRLLTDAPPQEAMTIAKRLTDLNQHRQRVERSIYEQAVRMAEDQGMIGDDHRAIVLAHEDWHAGVVGIACSRLVEKFGRPVILLHKSSEACKGSGRSIDGYSIHEGLCSAAEHLMTYGGHAMAAGLSVSPDKLHAFAESFIAHANQHIEVDHLVPTLSIDCDAHPAELTVPVVERLLGLAPFGRGNRPPTIRLRNMIMHDQPRQIGSNGRHLQLRLRSDDPQGRQWLRVVWWGHGNRAADLAPGMRIDVAIEPALNAWTGRPEVEATVQDVRVCS